MKEGVRLEGQREAEVTPRSLFKFQCRCTLTSVNLTVSEKETQVLLQMEALALNQKHVDSERYKIRLYVRVTPIINLKQTLIFLVHS